MYQLAGLGRPHHPHAAGEPDDVSAIGGETDRDDVPVARGQPLEPLSGLSVGEANGAPIAAPGDDRSRRVEIGRGVVELIQDHEGLPRRRVRDERRHAA